MKTIPVREAVGMVIAHDMTQIIPGQFKGSRFKKGHIVKEEDIPILLSMGKEHIFVLELKDDMVHEDEAALRIAKCTAGDGIALSATNEGKVELSAKYDGLLKIDTKLLGLIVDNDDVMFATLHNNRLVAAGQKVAGTRVIPLAVAETLISDIEEMCKGKTLVEVKKLKPLKVGLVTTGNEIASGKIKDAFGDVLKNKFEKLGSHMMRQVIVCDDEKLIASAIKGLLEEGAEMIAVTGGMSVDPDDRTPLAIRKAGAEIVSYGAPVLPGAMFLLAYINGTPVVGLPGCVMYHSVSIFDLIIPRILAGEKPSREDIKALAHGGLCENCKTCHFPNCGFGKAN